MNIFYITYGMNMLAYTVRLHLFTVSNFIIRVFPNRY